MTFSVCVCVCVCVIMCVELIAEAHLALL